MGLFIRQDENRSQLQERLAAELRERAKAQSQGSDPLDQSKTSNLVKDTEQTSSRAVTVLIVAAIVIGIVIAFIYTR